MHALVHGQDVFGPDEIQQLETALKCASDHFKNAYGFSGNSLKAAQTIAASAIFRRRREGVHSLSGLIDAATEAVRQWLKGERIHKAGKKLVSQGAVRTSKTGMVWVNYKRLFPDQHSVDMLVEERDQSTLH